MFFIIKISDQRSDDNLPLTDWIQDKKEPILKYIAVFNPVWYLLMFDHLDMTYVQERETPREIILDNHERNLPESKQK